MVHCLFENFTFDKNILMLLINLHIWSIMELWEPVAIYVVIMIDIKCVKLDTIDRNKSKIYRYTYLFFHAHFNVRCKCIPVICWKRIFLLFLLLYFIFLFSSPSMHVVAFQLCSIYHFAKTGLVHKVYYTFKRER